MNAYIGAAAFSHFTVGSGIPWFVALILRGLVAVPIGARLAIPAIRLTGLYLALATFGFGILLQNMFYTENYMFGSNGNGRRMPRPSIASGDKAYIIVLGGAPWDAVLASAALFLIPSYVSGAQVTIVLQLIFGATAILFAILPAGARGVAPAVQRIVEGTSGRIRMPLPRRRTTALGPEPTPGPALSGGLAVTDLEVRFGGLLAVNGVSLKAPAA